MGRDRAEMPFLDHLEELRRRIIWSLAALVVMSIGGFFLVTRLDVIGVLARPIRSALPDQPLMFTSPTTPVVVTLKLSLLVGFVLALPVLAWQAWAFLSPALYDRERRLVVPSISIAFGLFLAGLAMAYFFALPVGLQFLLGFQAESLQPIITIDEYLKFATRLILAFGVIFEMPVVFVVLGLLGVVTPAGLRRYRRHAVVGLAVVAAFLTPADVGTMLMLLVPMVLLYELSIWLVRLTAGRPPALVDGATGAGAAEEGG